MSYQPVLRSGAVVRAGERPCADRYRVIKHVAGMLPTPFTVLDVGAAEGYFPIRLAGDFDCVVTAIDDNPELTAAASDRVGVIDRRVTATDLRALPRHDMVLALSVLHHFSDWRRVLAELRSCRHMLIVEVPDPRERWMRSAAARHELREIHDTVAGLASARLGVFPRTGRDGSQHNRPMFAVPGSIVTLTGTVFSGSGTCGRKLTPAGHANGLHRELGYQPFPGSLNLRLDIEPDLGPPAVDWPGRINGQGKKRPYQFWPAWLDGAPLHVMIPGPRGHGPNHIELVAPLKLRDELGLVDGDTVTVDVARG